MNTLLTCLLTLTSARATTTVSPGAAQTERLVQNAARLQKSIDEFYARKANGPAITEPLAEGGGLAAVANALARVIHHMKDPGEVAVARTVDILDAILTLVVSTPKGTPLPFVARQIERSLTTLLDHFKDEPRVVDQLVPLIDVTSAWSSAHLPALAKQAGRAVRAEAVEYANYARQIDGWHAPDVERMVKAIRELRLARRTPEQWGLLGLSGVASVNESASILEMAAHAYAKRDVESPIFADDHPLRAALEAMMAHYENDDLYMRDVLTEAAERSKKEGNRLSPRAERIHFYRAFAHAVLLDPTDPLVTYDPEGPAAAPVPTARVVNAPPSAPAPAREEGNVIYPQFGCNRRLER